MPKGEKQKGWRKLSCVNGHVNPPRYKGGDCIPCARERSKNRDQRAYRAAVKLRKGPPAPRNPAGQGRCPEKARDGERATRLKVPVAVVRQVIAESGGVCGACSKELSHDQMCVDHDHATGQIRGVLCRRCNMVEGILTSNVERVMQIRRYLYRASEKVVERESPFPDTENSV